MLQGFDLKKAQAQAMDATVLLEHCWRIRGIATAETLTTNYELADGVPFAGAEF